MVINLPFIFLLCLLLLPESFLFDMIKKLCSLEAAYEVFPHIQSLLALSSPFLSVNQTFAAPVSFEHAFCSRVSSLQHIEIDLLSRLKGTQHLFLSVHLDIMAHQQFGYDFLRIVVTNTS